MPSYPPSQEFDPCLEGQGLQIGIVMSRFNRDISEGLLSACMAELSRLEVDPRHISIVSVPGALEIPLALQQLAQTGQYQALIALGAVVRGETYHFEVVANESAAGITHVQLSSNIPVANAILTTESEDQALVRMMQKGQEAAQVAVEMANLMRQIDEEC